jgi:hypothetical protein
MGNTWFLNVKASRVNSKCHNWENTLEKEQYGFEVALYHYGSDGVCGEVVQKLSL